MEALISYYDMRITLKTLIILTLISMTFACNTRKEQHKTPEFSSSETSLKNQYSVDPSAITIRWTAYKFTTRVGVSGTFTKATFQNKNSIGTVDALLKESRLRIPTASVYSNNEIRDPKLRDVFFKTLDTHEIIGNIKTAKDSRGKVSIRMNSLDNEVPYSYSIEKDTLLIKTHVDISDWNGNIAIQKLNEACDELHKGADGLSKLWPDVQIDIKIPLIEVSKEVNSIGKQAQ